MVYRLRVHPVSIILYRLSPGQSWIFRPNVWTFHVFLASRRKYDGYRWFKFNFLPVYADSASFKTSAVIAKRCVTLLLYYYCFSIS
jgi:hypothetical protein